MSAKKILVVDDDIEFSELIKLRLQANNYEVITASSGREALDFLREKRPDAVLLDILMPGADGLETLKKIRKFDKRLPVFIITAFSNEERFRLANKFAASGFIVKTSDLKKEVENITSALNISQRYNK